MKNYLRYSELALRKQTDRTKDNLDILLITDYGIPTVKNYLRASQSVVKKYQRGL